MILLIITTFAAALIAGLFFNWSVAIMPGLKQLSDLEFMHSMQAINRAILNPVFLLCFMAPVLLFPISAYLHYGSGQAFWLLVSASALYIIGVFGVTAAGNLPLNNMLDAINTSLSNKESLAQQRAAFSIPWNRLNHIRSFASLLALLLSIIACCFYSSQNR